jgi:hypothetical protein
MRVDALSAGANAHSERESASDSYPRLLARVYSIQYYLLLACLVFCVVLKLLLIAYSLYLAPTVVLYRLLLQ